MTRVLLFTDQPILAKGFAALLSGAPQFDLVAVCYEPMQLVETAALGQPDLLLIDLSPEITLDVISRLRQGSPDCRIVLWVHSMSLELAYQTMRLGIHGILRRTLETDILIRCLEKVSQGEFWFEETLTAGLMDATTVPLSRRESQLISLLAQGLKNKEIAHALSISEGTIKVYLSRLFRKVGVKDRYELALYGLKNDMAHLALSDLPRQHKEPRTTATRENPPRLLVNRLGR